MSDFLVRFSPKDRNISTKAIYSKMCMCCYILKLSEMPILSYRGVFEDGRLIGSQASPSRQSA